VARPDATGTGRACVRCDVTFSSETKSAAARNQRLRRKAEAVERANKRASSIPTVISLTFRADCGPSRAGRSVLAPKFGNKSGHPSVFLPCGHSGRGKRRNR
jgi:hypothetical protein